MLLSSLLFCGLGFTLLHPRLATPAVGLFLSAVTAQGLALFYDLASAPMGKFSPLPPCKAAPGRNEPTDGSPRQRDVGA